MILVGIGRHAVSDRWFGGETSLRVVQLAHVPVLAVHAEARTLPRRVLVADDFSDFAREAGRLAQILVDAGGEVHLAHVLWVPVGTDAGAMSDEWVDSYQRGVQTQLEERRQALTREGKGTVHVHSLRGEPASALLHLAEQLDVDLISAGRHGRGFLGRLLIGSVSTRLIRRADRSVLVVPPPAEDQAD